MQGIPPDCRLDVLSDVVIIVVVVVVVVDSHLAALVSIVVVVVEWKGGVCSSLVVFGMG